jgi:hypothetical protein
VAILLADFFNLPVAVLHADYHAGGFFGVIMYFTTVESATSYPNSFNSD